MKEALCKINNPVHEVMGPGIIGIKLPITPTNIKKIPMTIIAKSILKSEVSIFRNLKIEMFE
tara:strand:- start:5276 stop:5461 length:186 start_codon:yes stop_codon:yes gene_type:complete